MALEGLDTRLNRTLWKESGKLKFCDELHTDTPGESCGQPPILRSPSPKCWTRKSVRQFAFPWIETKCNTFDKWKLNHEGEMAKLIFRGWMRGRAKFVQFEGFKASYFVSETPISYKEKKRAINERELKVVVNNFFWPGLELRKVRYRCVKQWL